MSKEQTGFKEGDAKKFEANIKAFEKQANIAQANTNLTYGPLVKNKYTLEMETLVKAFLSGEKVTYKWVNDQKGNEKGKIEASFTKKPSNENVKIDLTTALKYANFNHFNFSNVDYQNYIDFLNKKGNFTRNDSRIKPETREGTLPTPDYFANREKVFKINNPDVSFAEKCAINIYTKQDELKEKTNYYALMNAFLRGDISYFQKNSSNLSSDCNELMAHLGMCISGLNKSNPEILPEVVWREVPEMPEKITLESIEARATGQVTNHMGMVSTNKGRPKDMGTLGGGNYIMFKNVKGIDVSPYSKFGHQAGGSEREILMPPTQIVWTHHAPYLFNPKDPVKPIGAGLSDADKTKLKIENAKKQVHFFIAEPVTTLTNMPEEALKQVIDSVNNSSSNRIEEKTSNSILQEFIPPNPDKNQNSLPIAKNNPVPPIAKNNPVPPPIAKKPPNRSPENNVIDNVFDIQPLKPIIEHTFKEYLSKPYTERQVFASDFDLDTSKGRIERPNHGLAHSVRKASYIAHLTTALKKNLPTSTFNNITPADIRKMQAAMLFSVSGRLSDTGFSLHDNAYARYKQNSSNNFKQYFSAGDKGIFSSPEEMQNYATLIKLMCMPLDKVKQLPDFPSPRDKYLNLLTILTLCHELDEQRCWNGPAYQRTVMEPLAKLVGQEAADELKNLVYDELKATGNKIMISSAKGRPQGYQENLFYDVSTDVNTCLDKVQAVSLKDIKTKEVRADDTTPRISPNRAPTMSDGPRPPGAGNAAPRPPVTGNGPRPPVGNSPTRPPVPGNGPRPPVPGNGPRPPVLGNGPTRPPVAGNAPRPPVGNSPTRPPVPGNGPRPPVPGNGPRPPVSGNGPRPPVPGNSPAKPPVSGYSPTRPPVPGNSPTRPPVPGNSPTRPPVPGNNPTRPPVAGNGPRPPTSNGPHRPPAVSINPNRPQNNIKPPNSNKDNISPILPPKKGPRNH